MLGEMSLVGSRAVISPERGGGQGRHGVLSHVRGTNRPEERLQQLRERCRR